MVGARPLGRRHSPALPRRSPALPLRSPALLVAACAVAFALAGCSAVTLAPPEVHGEPVRVPEQSYVLDANGDELAVLRQEFRESVALDDVPEHLIDAVVAAEDRRFWTHRGVDARAVLRAAIRNRVTGTITEGGSTITQQLVKNLYMPSAPRTMETKLHESLLARDLEARWSKQEILERYLNTVYYGNGAYGIRAAAFTYWRKDADELSLDESAMLAGLIRAPESGNPTNNPDVARARRDQVLDAMVEEGMLTAGDAESAKQHGVEVEPRPTLPEVRHPYWVDFTVRTLLEDRHFAELEVDRADMLFGGGLRVYTTIDPVVQEAAEAAAQRFLSGENHPEVAIAVIETQTGRVLATVGGRDYERRQFDLATQGRRQPGSAFKPFVLTAAIGAGYRPDTRVNGNQGTLHYGDGLTYRVRNYDRRNPGRITLAQATRASVNGAFARLILDVGIDRTISVARTLGITSPLNPDPAIALGGLTHGVTTLEMAAAFATLGRMGERVTPNPIERIEDAEGNVVWRPDRAPQRALDPGIAWVVTDILTSVVENGTGVRARIPGVEVAGKTGTTSDHTDAWFVGYTPAVTVAVWVGHPERRVPMRNVSGVARVTGGSWPARIWRELVAELHASILGPDAPTAFELPEGASIEVEIDPETGLLAAPWCPGETVVMPRLLAPTETCPSPAPTPPPSPTPPPTPAPTPSPSPTASPPDDPSPTTSPTATPTDSPSPTTSPTEPPDDDEPDPDPPDDPDE